MNPNTWEGGSSRGGRYWSGMLTGIGSNFVYDCFLLVGLFFLWVNFLCWAGLLEALAFPMRWGMVGPQRTGRVMFAEPSHSVLANRERIDLACYTCSRKNHKHSLGHCISLADRAS